MCSCARARSVHGASAWFNFRPRPAHAPLGLGGNGRPRLPLPEGGEASTARRRRRRRPGWRRGGALVPRSLQSAHTHARARCASLSTRYTRPGLASRGGYGRRAALRYGSHVVPLLSVEGTQKSRPACVRSGRTFMAGFMQAFFFPFFVYLHVNACKALCIFHCWVFW